MNDDFVNTIFEKKEKLGSFNFSSELIESLEQEKRNYGDKIFLIIGEFVSEEQQDKLDNLIEKYTETVNNLNFEKNKLFYKTGIIDGMNLSKNNE